jgi:hypothetical protein
MLGKSIRTVRRVLRFGLAGLLASYFSPAAAADMDFTAYKNPQYGVVGWGGWIFHPSVILGAVYDDNVYRSATNQVHQWGTRVIPSFTAELNEGIYRTNIHGTVDGRFYSHEKSADAVDAKAGIQHIYEPTRDLTFRFSGDYIRQADPFTAGVVAPNGVPVITNNSVNVVTGTASVQKDIGRAFVVLGESVTQTNYDASFQHPRNGTIYATTARTGVWATPYINVFAEGTYDWRRYAADIFDSQGYRVVGGLGSGQIGLLKGEVYGGYQAEHYDHSDLFGLSFGEVSSSVYGAKLSYFPTRYLTLKVLVDRIISVSSVPTVGTFFGFGLTPGVSLGTPMLVTHTVFEAEWGLWRQVSLSGRFGYDHATYVLSPRVDDAWLAGARINYEIWRNLGLSFDYQYTKLDSTVPLNSYRRNMFLVGALYRY